MATRSARRLWLAVAGIDGALGVCGGAMAAHLTEAGGRDLVETAVRYQLYHAVALLALAAWPGPRGRWRDIAGGLFVAGTVLFSGSLYAAGGWNLPPTPLIPLGGGCLILGWAALAVSAWRDRLDG